MWKAPGIATSRRQILLLGTYEDSGGWCQILASFPMGAPPAFTEPALGLTGISLLSPQSPHPHPPLLFPRPSVLSLVHSAWRGSSRLGSPQRNHSPNSNPVYLTDINHFSARHPWVTMLTEFRSLLHLTEDILPAKGRSGGKRRVRNPTPSHKEFKVISCCTVSHSFIQQTFMEDLPCDRNYVREYKYE